ncbi:MAG: SpoIIE family protein phosphatase [Ilumatobacter fluminis]|uniref:PP2C family protein-serine/threonine phosphatase n=1 Tax=Ilumatobacter fluminis TaxID=467091 RepID=UPI0032EB29DF
MTTDRPLERLALPLVERQREGVVVQAADGSIIDFNAAALRRLKMTADELTGVTSLDPRWEAVDARRRPLAGEDHPAMRALASGRDVVGATMGVRVDDGSYTWLSIDSRLFADGDDTVVVTQFLDVTTEFEQRERMTAALDRLQHHALPTTALHVDWVHAATRYASVTPPLDIGGDFVDVFAVSDDRCGFFIGDVCGHDLDAVATMVIARHTLRAAGLHLQRPARVLAWLHDALTTTPGTAYCSAVFGHVSRREAADGLDVQFVNAGHPAPVVVRADGSVDRPVGHGRLLGMIPEFVTPPIVEVPLSPGDHLVLFTDGLIESRRPRMSDDDLVERLVGSTSLDHTMGAIDELMHESAAQSLSAQDDIAVLAVGAPRHPRV